MSLRNEMYSRGHVAPDGAKSHDSAHIYKHCPPLEGSLQILPKSTTDWPWPKSRVKAQDFFSTSEARWEWEQNL